MLKQRVITAIILAIVVVGTILGLNSFYVSLLFAAVLFFAISETVNLTLSHSHVVQWLAALGMIALYFVALPDMGIRLIAWHSYVGLILWMLVLLALTRYRHSGHWSLPMRAAVALFSAILLWICVQDLNFIHRHFDNGGWLLMYLLTLVWVADIGAYFSGK